MGHANGGVAVFAHAEAHFDVGLCGFCYCVSKDIVVGFFGGGLNKFHFFGIHEEFVLVPSDFAFAHPKGGNLDFHLRPFVVFAMRFFGRAAHQKPAGGNGNHVKLHFGSGNGFGVALHVGFFALFCGSDDFGVDLGEEFYIHAGGRVVTGFFWR